MTFLIYTLHVLICFFLIAVVLLQQGKGADLSVFGGGGTQTAFGARGAATVLHKMTVGSFIAFIVTTMAIGVLQTDDEGSGVLGGLPETTEEAAPAEPEPQGALPTSEDDAAEDDAAEDDAATTDATATDEEAADSAEPAADTPDGEGDSPDTEGDTAAEEPGSEGDDGSQGEG